MIGENENRTIAIVDPFSSGRFLAPLLKKKFGTKCVAILSSQNLPAFYLNGFQRSDFADTMTATSLDATAAFLKRHRVDSVIAGSEPGVIWADRLGVSLGLSGNVPALTEARRDKYLMGEAVRAAGLRAAAQTAARSSSEALIWIQNHATFPVVLKPKDSAGTDGVALTNGAADVEAYFDKYLGSQHMLALPVEEILVQEFLEGNEYVVDTVSQDGKHQVVAVWRYAKKKANGSDFVYDTMGLLTSLTGIEMNLVSYTLQCLDALGIQQGPAHCEVMLTVNGPVLIEIGARIHGGNGTLISGVCVGYNQIDRTAMLHADAEQFKATFKPHYESEKAALEIFLISPVSGFFAGLRNEDTIRQLPSFHSMTFNVKGLEKLARTVDLFTSPGRVILIGTPEQIATDYTLVRQWEDAGAYVTH